ncbi:MAG TPA: nickel pincer cofactor biosynthesis protein LarC [Nocardioidaceae bacterium]|nr:nickel pincer cofactor biosynthesis protein LarC [Nocardioidaceae bacterium]
MIGWVDASAGASGDMLLAALVGAGVSIDTLQAAVTAVAPERVELQVEDVQRGGLAATRCHVEVADSRTHRTWRDIEGLLEQAALSESVRVRAAGVFARLAEAEGRVHGIDPADVSFHEVGALDAIADVVGVCAGIDELGLDRVVVSAVAVGSGWTRSAHGQLPVPPPAVAELLRGVPSYAGPEGAAGMELCTPTGAALLTATATSYGPQPAMTVAHVGAGAGSKDPPGRANVLRLFVGEPVVSRFRGAPPLRSSAPQPPTQTAPLLRSSTTDEALVLETNVDDLDPRLWPNVIASLLKAGASDAWLTPILMKKGRPAHTLSVLVRTDLPTVADAVRTEIFRQTSTIGLRESLVAKTALERQVRTVDVTGGRVRVKLALHDGEVVNVQPEYDDVARLAAATGRPAKDVLADAIAVTRTFDHARPSGSDT